jgi:hypothetical protein
LTAFLPKLQGVRLKTGLWVLSFGNSPQGVQESPDTARFDPGSLRNLTGKEIAVLAVQTPRREAS